MIAIHAIARAARALTPMPHIVTRYTFTVRDLTAPLHVRRVELREALSEPYRLTLELLTPDQDITPADLLGAACRLTIAHSPGPARDVHGLVLRVETLDHGELRHLRLEIGPALALHAHRVATRLWQHTSVPDIIKDVLEDSLTAHGRRLRLDLAAAYPPRETCTQYRETDLAFVQRILHEEGIAFAFDHDDDAEVLVLLDDNARCPVVGDLAFVPPSASVAAAESVERLDPVRTLGVTSLLQTDWSPLAAADAPHVNARLAQDDRGRERLVHEHDDRRVDQDDGMVRARRKLEQRTQLATAATGEATALAFAPARRFDLGGHPDPARDARWLLLRVDHRGTVPEADRLADPTAADQAPTYINTFTCVPDTIKLRPPHTPELTRPRVHGPHTAIVVGPEGEEIHTDEHGRIRVRFHWDRTDRRGDDCSCWVRVAQTWAGPGWGGLFLPRIGMEVLVEFIDGDPDRPLVTGCVYNSLNRPPVTLPDHKTRSALTSESTPGGGLANQILLEDARGRESLTLATRRDLHTRAGHDHTADITHDQTTNVGANQTTDVGANQVTTVLGNCDLTVSDGELTTTVATKSRTTSIHENDTTTVTTGNTLHRTMLGTHTLQASKLVDIKSDTEGIHLTAPKTVDIQSSKEKLILRGHGSTELHSDTDELKLRAEKMLSLASYSDATEVRGKTDLHLMADTGNLQVTVAKNTVVTTGELTDIYSQALTVHADECIQFKVGTNYIKISGEGIELHGKNISIDAANDNILKGKMIRLN